MFLGKRFHILLFYLLFISCSQQNESEIKVIKPDQFLNRNIVLSDLVDEINYICLSQDILFRNIYCLSFSDEFIFLGTDQGLLKYSCFGKYLGKIGEIGQGPMDYSRCGDFTIDPEQKQVYIRDNPYLKVFSFDGHFIKTILLKEYNPIRTIYLDGKLYLFNLLLVNPERTPSFWSVIDTTGKAIDEKTNFDIIFEGNGMTYGTYPYVGKDHIGYWNHFNDTVFHIYNEEVKPVYVWFKGSYRLTAKNCILEDTNDFLTITRLFDTKNFLYISYSQYGKPHICVYNKNKDQFSKMSINDRMKEGVTNNIDQGLPMKPTYFSVIYGEEYFVQTVYPSILIEHLEKNDVKDPSLLDFVDQITEEDNQIIILYKLM